MTIADYESLVRRVRQLQTEGLLPLHPTHEQKLDWAYGNAVIENDEITLDRAAGGNQT